MSAHGVSHAKWYCETCSTDRAVDHPVPCRECCGFHAASDALRSRLERTLERVWDNSLTAIMAEEIPEFRDALRTLDEYANGATS